jgi:hypothetical protein
MTGKVHDSSKENPENSIIAGSRACGIKPGEYDGRIGVWKKALAENVETCTYWAGANWR